MVAYASSRLGIILLILVIFHHLYHLEYCLFLQSLRMDNCLSSSHVTKMSKGIPIETTFTLPSALPAWPSGSGFADGYIDLGGLCVCQVSSLNKIWTTYEGGPGNHGATFFEPSSLPKGYVMLGCYGQPNNKPYHGWLLAAKDETNDPSNGALKEPTDYTLVWSSESSRIKGDGNCYVWLPIPPDGYKAVGNVITRLPNKPALDKTRCVRCDFTEQCEIEEWIWGTMKRNNASEFNVYGIRPKIRGAQALGVSVGTFITQTSGNSSPPPLACLKNNNPNYTSAMPNMYQIEELIRAYSPLMYFHPDEVYLPSSVRWFFTNGALLYKRGEESNPCLIEPTGSNLPQGGSNDGAYWLDLPTDKKAKEKVKKGDLDSAQAYVHVKPALGATFSDIVLWIFYPFNGPGTAKVGFFNVSLGKIGEHVGDWEHLTLRISNFNGELSRVYFSQHSKGTWVNASELEFQDGNKFVAYVSLHGHAMYPKPGLVLQGSGIVGIRNDTAKSRIFMDTSKAYSIVAIDHLGLSGVEHPWLEYYREWGPKICYDIPGKIKVVDMFLPQRLRFIRIPNEVFGEEGPVGPKGKINWLGDERV